MKLEALDHPKTLDLMARLGVSLPTVIGHLELLWAFTAKRCPQGNVGKWNNGTIAQACHWQGDASHFIDALREVGFIDADSAHRLIVHDWQDHAAGWVRAKLKNSNLEFVTPSTPTSTPTSTTTSTPTSTKTSTAASGATIQALTKPSQDKPSQDHTLRARDAAVRQCWEGIRAAYPRGTYREVAWLNAERKYRALTEAGHEPGELEALVVAYQRQQQAKRAIGSQFVLSPENFFSENNWRGPFPLPETKAEIRQAANLTAAEQWLRASEESNAT